MSRNDHPTTPEFALYALIAGQAPISRICDLLNDQEFIDDLLRWMQEVHDDDMGPFFESLGNTIDIQDAFVEHPIYPISSVSESDSSYYQELAVSAHEVMKGKGCYLPVYAIYLAIPSECQHRYTDLLQLYFKDVLSHYGPDVYASEIGTFVGQYSPSFDYSEEGGRIGSLSKVIAEVKRLSRRAKLSKDAFIGVIESINGFFTLLYVDEDAHRNLTAIVGGELSATLCSDLLYFDCATPEAPLSGYETALLGALVHNADVKTFDTRSFDLDRIDWQSNIVAVLPERVSNPSQALSNLYFKGFISLSEDDISRNSFHRLDEEGVKAQTYLRTKSGNYFLSDTYSDIEQWHRRVQDEVILTGAHVDEFVELLKFRVVDRLFTYLIGQLEQSSLHVDFSITKQISDLVVDCMDSFKIGELINVFYSAANGAISRRAKGVSGKQAGNIAKSFIKRGLTDPSWKLSIYDWPAHILPPAEWDTLQLFGFPEWRQGAGLSLMDIRDELYDRVVNVES